MSNQNPMRRVIHPEVRVIDATNGLVEYVASDETLDSYSEVIRADGWRFTDFKKNSPFVDSHNYDSVDNLLGSVIDFKVDGGKLVETVKWAIDVAENALAQFGFRMLQGGYLRAVSVGFWPVNYLTKYSQDRDAWIAQLKELGLDEINVRTIYTEQEQTELSAVILGANPNALILARAYKANVLTDADVEWAAKRISSQRAVNETSSALADDDGDSIRRQRQRFLDKLECAVARL